MTLWKAVERRIADLLGGERVPITGRQRGDVPDVEHPWLSIEIKLRGKEKFPPAWISDALDQAIQSSDGKKCSIVVFHGYGDSYNDAVVMMKLGDFLKLKSSSKWEKTPQ